MNSWVAREKVADPIRDSGGAAFSVAWAPLSEKGVKTAQGAAEAL
jgi:hypothetical protein